jgi:hypothetical protein
MRGWSWCLYRAGSVPIAVPKFEGEGAAVGAVREQTIMRKHARSREGQNQPSKSPF